MHATKIKYFSRAILLWIVFEVRALFLKTSFVLAREVEQREEATRNARTVVVPGTYVL